MNRTNFYDALPAASDAAVFITALGWIAWTIFPSDHLFFWLMALAIVLASMYALSTRSILLGKKQLHDAPLPKAKNLEEHFSDEEILQQEQAHEKENWEGYVQLYNLHEELHTSKGINQTIRSVWLGYIIIAFLVSCPFLWFEKPNWISAAIALVLLILLSLLTSKITQRSFWTIFIRNTFYLILLILSFELLFYIFKK